jgi:hypothetical protein
MALRALPSLPPALRLLAALALALPACAARAPGAQSADHLAAGGAETVASFDAERPRHIMTVHRRKCGACHTPVEPGSVPRVEAEAAMRRHRHRARLTEREWNDMVEYISDDGDLHGRPTAHLP